MRSDLYANMMRAESVAIQFTNEDDAENYVLDNPTAIAKVVAYKNGVVLSTFYGADYGFSK